MSVTGTTQPSLPADTTSSISLGSPCPVNADSQGLSRIEETITTGPRQHRVRKDSGYSESRRPIYRLPSDDGSLTFLELQRSVNEPTRPKDLVSRHSYRATRDNSNSSAGSSRSLRGERQQKDNHLIIEPIDLIVRQEIESPISINDSDEPCKSPCRSINLEQRAPAENCILVYAKSIPTVEALELFECSISSSETTRPSSRMEEGPDEEFATRNNALTTASTIDLEVQQFSPLHVATNVDWTNPSTRQQVYKRHDRNQQIFRRWIRKIVPRKLQAEQVQFYDGNSDAGSVRRYRLDIDQTSIQDTTRDNVRSLRHVLSCFSSLRSTSRTR